MAAINGCTRFVTAKNYTTALLPFVDKTAYTEVNPMQREHSMNLPFYALTAADYIGFLILLSPVAKAYRVNDSESWLFWALALVYFLILGINIWKSVHRRKRSWLYTGIVCVCAIELIWYLITQAIYWRDMVQLGFSFNTNIAKQYAICVGYCILSLIGLFIWGYFLNRKRTDCT